MPSPETDYPTPPQQVLDELVDAALTAAGTRRTSVEWVAHGSSSLVGLVDEVAVRVARSPAGGAELRRAQALVDALPTLPFAVPRSVADAVEVAGYVAVPVQRITGAAQAPQPVPGARVIEMIDAIHAIPVEPLRPLLAPPRVFMGGADWQAVLTERAVPLLPTDLRTEAVGRVQRLAALPTVDPVLNHGDLGGTNVHWDGPVVAGVLDWDLAAPEDPAEDVAAAAWTFGVWDEAAERFGPEVIERAWAFRRSFPLQVLAFAVLHDRPAHEIERVVARVSRSLRRDVAGTG